VGELRRVRLLAAPRKLGGRAEAHDAGDVLGAGPALTLLAAAGDLGGGEDSVTGHQRAHALGPVRLVRAEAEEVHPQGAEAEGEPAQGLDRVGVHQGSRVAGTNGGGDGRDVLDGPHLVVGEHHRDEHGVGSDG
jgi:hypothetical protein